MFKFLRLREADLPMVLDWRTKPRVADVMMTKVKHDIEAQRRWFAGLKDPYWVIHSPEKPIGVINLAGDDSFGFYIGEDDAVPLGGLVLPYFYNHVFKTKGWPVLEAEVLNGNDGVMALHRFHGYHLTGYRVHGEAVTSVFDLTCHAWEKQASRYGHFVAEFE